jgi:pimeloyl-ACP methyl ester carboxylesterase
MPARFLPAVEKLARFAMNRSGMTSRWVEAGGLRLHAYDGPGGGTLPPVVLFHGIGSAGAAFARVAGHLRPHVRRVVVPELPGHGFSTRDHRPVTPDLLLDVMTEAVDRLVDEPAVIYGNSLGGALAIKYALRRPERVKKLVLVSPAGAPLPDDEWKELVSAFHVPSRREALVFLQRLYHRPPWFLAILAHEFPDVLGKAAVREILESASNEDSPRPDELAALAMPILLLWGRSEKLLPASGLKYFRTHLPRHALIEEPEGFGHTPQLEVPRRVADRMLRFMREG